MAVTVRRSVGTHRADRRPPWLDSVPAAFSAREAGSGDTVLKLVALSVANAAARTANVPDSGRLSAASTPLGPWPSSACT